MNGPDKHKFIAHERVFKNGFVNFTRNAWLAIAAIAMMSITLTILLFLVVANSTINKSISEITNKIDVTAYLKDADKPAQIEDLRNRLKELPNVASVSYISKDQALKDYRAKNASNVTQLEALNALGFNPLPASLSIKPIDPNNLQPIRDFLAEPDNAALQLSKKNSPDQTRQQAVDKIAHAGNFFKQAGIVGTIIFMFVSAMIIFNTIRMAIFNRREELTIMRLLGATTWYIRGPFVIETMIYGVIAAIAATSICWFLFVNAADGLNASTLGLIDISYSHDLFTHRLPQILGGEILAGILIGSISSYVATRRYLKFKSS